MLSLTKDHDAVSSQPHRADELTSVQDQADDLTSVQVPRITRQAVLDRLAGQHLALTLHKSGKDISRTEIPSLGDEWKKALMAAVEQEEGIYQQGKASKAVSPF